MSVRLICRFLIIAITLWIILQGLVTGAWVTDLMFFACFSLGWLALEKLLKRNKEGNALETDNPTLQSPTRFVWAFYIAYILFWISLGAVFVHVTD